MSDPIEDTGQLVSMEEAERAAGELQNNTLILPPSPPLAIPSPYNPLKSEAWFECPDLFCPACGEKGRSYCSESSDFYLGESYLCAACGNSFYKPQEEPTEADKKRIESLRDVEALCGGKKRLK